MMCEVYSKVNIKFIDSIIYIKMSSYNMVKFIMILLLSLFFITLKAQTPEYLNYTMPNKDSLSKKEIKLLKSSVSYELIGAAGAFSINYERLIKSRNSLLSIRVGAGYNYDVGFFDGALPISLTHLFKIGNNYLEIGPGFTLTTFGDRFLNGIIGYRFLIKENSKTIKINMNFRYEPEWGYFSPTPGISFGYNF